MTAGDPASWILVDSSLWIEFYRPDGSEELRELLSEALLSGVVATTPIIVTEVARGAPGPEALRDLLQDFGALRSLDPTSEEGARGARIGHALRRSGSTVPATDVHIAAVAVGAGCELWHQDRHFTTISSVTALRERAFLREQS